MKTHSAEFEKLCEQARKGVKEISVSEVKQLSDEDKLPLLLDIREDHEWQQGHLPGATHLGRGILERDIEKLVPDKATPMILYCGGGYRSVLSVESLQKMGYIQASSMAGGIRAWLMSDYPIENNK